MTEPQPSQPDRARFSVADGHGWVASADRFDAIFTHVDEPSPTRGRPFTHGRDN